MDFFFEMSDKSSLSQVNVSTRIQGVGIYIPYDVLVMLEYLKKLHVPVSYHFIKESTTTEVSTPRLEFEGTISSKNDEQTLRFLFPYDMIKALIQVYPSLAHQLQVSTPSCQNLLNSIETQLISMFRANLAPNKDIPNTILVDFSQLLPCISQWNHHLTMRTFFVGYSTPSLVDVVVYGLLKNSAAWMKKFKEFIEANPSTMGGFYPHLVRWFNVLESLFPFVEVSTRIRENKTITKRREGQDIRLNLPGVEKGNVVTRFPPEPSGYLHIGHAKAALLNEWFAHSNEGKLIVRFDDTNPKKEKVEYERAILEDLKTLGIQGDRYSYTSDYFEELIGFAEKMIREGHAYVDDTPVERMRDERMIGKASVSRDLPVEAHLERWDHMKRATELGMLCCLRAKIDMDATNKALRDPVLYRCHRVTHQRTNDRYLIYPTYDFACPIVDSIEGVTHAFRTSEYHDRNEQYYWILDRLGLRKPLIWDYSRMSFVYTLLSKRKLQWFVDEKRVSGWDDPRFPTIRGVMRRGLTVPALREYILLQGPSKNTLLLEWDKLWAINKQHIDPVAPRYTAIARDHAIPVTFLPGKDVPSTPYTLELPKHKKQPNLGTKTVWYASAIYIEGDDARLLRENEQVTLMDWGNAWVRRIDRKLSIDQQQEERENPITHIEMELFLEGDYKLTERKLTWLAQVEENRMPVDLVEFDFLITKKKLEEDDRLEACLNEISEFRTVAWGDANLRHITRGTILQLERRGYFICDEMFSSSGKVVLFSIPDGKTKPMSTLSTKVLPIGARNRQTAENLQQSDAGSCSPPIQTVCNGTSSLSSELKTPTSRPTKDCKLIKTNEEIQKPPTPAMYRVTPIVNDLNMDKLMGSPVLYHVAAYEPTQVQQDHDVPLGLNQLHI